MIRGIMIDKLFYNTAQATPDNSGRPPHPPGLVSADKAADGRYLTVFTDRIGPRIRGHHVCPGAIQGTQDHPRYDVYRIGGSIGQACNLPHCLANQTDAADGGDFAAHCGATRHDPACRDCAHPHDRNGVGCAVYEFHTIPFQMRVERATRRP